MGQLTDTLRATLRDLAQSDARLYRGFQEELGDTRPASNQPAALLAGDVPANRDELERLSIKVLWELCKQRGITGLSKGPAAKQVDALLSHPDGPPLRSALPSKATKGGATGGRATAKAGAVELQALEKRLDRLERVLVLIAHHVGVPHEAIEQLLPGLD
jgi:hypothetical protein